MAVIGEDFLDGNLAEVMVPSGGQRVMGSGLHD